MGEFNLMKFDGQPLEKLLDVISAGIGKIYKPRAIKKEADAEAYRIEVIERAKAKASAEGKEIEYTMYDRIQERILFREEKRQNNIDKISKIAAEQLSHEKTVSAEPVNEDWTTRFFNIVEDITDEQMQGLWGRILAGEVKNQKSYSLRTLDLLKNLNKHEADIFTNVANYSIASSGRTFIFRGNNDNILNDNGFPFEDRLLLIEIGLLQPETNIVRRLPSDTEDYITYFTSGKFIIKALKKANTPMTEIPVLRFTNIGEELLKLIHLDANQEYIKVFYRYLIESAFEVEYAFIINKQNDGRITHTQPWLKF